MPFCLRHLTTVSLSRLSLSFRSFGHRSFVFALIKSIGYLYWGHSSFGHRFTETFVFLSQDICYLFLRGRTFALRTFSHRRSYDEQSGQRAISAVLFLSSSSSSAQPDAIYRSDRDASRDFFCGGHLMPLSTLDLSDALRRTSYRRGPTSGASAGKAGVIACGFEFGHSSIFGDFILRQKLLGILSSLSSVTATVRIFGN